MSDNTASSVNSTAACCGSRAANASEAFVAEPVAVSVDVGRGGTGLAGAARSLQAASRRTR